MRQRRRAVVAAVVVSALLAGCTATGGTGPSTSSTSHGSIAAPTAPSAPTPTADTELAAAVMQTVHDFAEQNHLRAVLIRVTRGDELIVEEAIGESMSGVPATTDMHFRNGAVAISYLSTLLLRTVDEGAASLDDTVSTWLPDLPHAGEVTLGQLAQMTSGYVDYEQTPELTAANYADPFRQWTPEELLAYAVDQPLWYRPGTNWNYSHTNYVILGRVLEKISGQPLDQLMQDKILGPLGLAGTSGNDNTPAIPEPVLHAFSSERREALSVPAGVPFYEESTFWNPSWTLAEGAIQTTNLADLATSARALYSGQLLTPESYRTMVSTELRGKTTTIPGCAACFEQNLGYTYGLGVVISGDWLLQNPLFSGAAAVGAYLPGSEVTIAVAVTYQPEAFDPATGAYSNQADHLWREVAAVVVPENAPPLRRG